MFLVHRSIFQVQSKRDIDTVPEEGAYINGLFMEGARWNYDKNVIDEALPKVLYDEFPTVKILSNF